MVEDVIQTAWETQTETEKKIIDIIRKEKLTKLQAQEVVNLLKNNAIIRKELHQL